MSMKKKNVASQFMKPIIASFLASLTKAKACASTIKLFFSVLRNKKLLAISGSLSRKLSPQPGKEEQATSKDIIIYQADQGGGSIFRSKWWHGLVKSRVAKTEGGDHDDEDDYAGKFEFPDLTHSLFDDDCLGYAELDDEEEGVVNGGSVLEMVKNSREESGEEFRLEEEIDRVADMFIRRFHLQQRMQRQLSLKNKTKI